MKKTFILTAARLVIVSAFALAWSAYADVNQVQFPQDFERGVHYATVHRGNITEELFTSRAAIEAAKAGQPFPFGTNITLVDYRDGELYRYVVMQKGEGFGAAQPEALRTGDWVFQWFNPDKSVNAGEDLGRCSACHQSQSSQDFVFTVDRMKQTQ